MRKFALYIGILSISFTSCDYVDDPYPEVIGTNADCDTTFNFTSVPSNQRNILLEEFTGHKCPNCPDGTADVQAIKTALGDRFIPVAIHPNPNEVSGFDSFVNENPPGTGKYETVWYVNGSGEIMNFLDVYIGLGLPTAAIQRNLNGPGNFYFNLGSWGTVVDTIINNNPTADVGINVAGEFLADGTICGKSEIHVFNSRTDTLRVVHYLVQDSIIDWQLDGSTDIPNYMHRHVLRGISGGDVFGQMVSYPSSSGVISQHTFSFDVSEYTSDEHLYIVAYVYSEATKEVLQAEEIHLEP